MICVNFASFRARFATRARVLPMPWLWFDFLAPNIINSQTFVWDAASPPFVPGMTLIMRGSALGQDTFTIGTIEAGGVLIYTVEQTVVNEGMVVMTQCDGVTFDKSGWERWPAQYMRVGDTGVPFAGGILRLYAWAPYKGGTIGFTCNSGVADSVFGVDEYDWFLSQRTDDPARQYLAIARQPDILPMSYSGCCLITPTALAATKFGFTIGGTTPLDPDVVRMLFRSCELYCRRISDQAIQRADLLLKVQGG